LSRNSRSLTTFTTHDNIMTCFRYLKHSSTSSILGIHLSIHLGHCITTILSISSSRRRKYQTPIPPTPHSYHTHANSQRRRRRRKIIPTSSSYPHIQHHILDCLLPRPSLVENEGVKEGGRKHAYALSQHYDNNDLSVSNSNPVQECVNYSIQVPVPSLFFQSLIQSKIQDLNRLCCIDYPQPSPVSAN
jgi:hypothetical protein